MDATGLRQLARQYADGHIDRQSYLEARTRYLEAIIRGESPEPVTQANYTTPKAVAGEETITARTFRNNQTVMLNRLDAGELLHQQTQPIRLSQASLWPRLAAAIAALVIALIVLVMLLTGD